MFVCVPFRQTTDYRHHTDSRPSQITHYTTQTLHQVDNTTSESRLHPATPQLATPPYHTIPRHTTYCFTRHHATRKLVTPPFHTIPRHTTYPTQQYTNLHCPLTHNLVLQYIMPHPSLLHHHTTQYPTAPHITGSILTYTVSLTYSLVLSYATPHPRLLHHTIPLHTTSNTTRSILNLHCSFTYNLISNSP